MDWLGHGLGEEGGGCGCCDGWVVGWGGRDGNGNGEVILKCIRASLQKGAEEF